MAFLEALAYDPDREADGQIVVPQSGDEYKFGKPLNVFGAGEYDEGSFAFRNVNGVLNALLESSSAGGIALRVRSANQPNVPLLTCNAGGGGSVGMREWGDWRVRRHGGDGSVTRDNILFCQGEAGNIGIGTGTFGTGADNFIGMKVGVKPSAGVTGVAHLGFEADGLWVVEPDGTPHQVVAW
jgi:hypothetical protein